MDSKTKYENDGELIDRVRNFPELYVQSNVNYKNNIRKSSIWNGIAKDLGFFGNFKFQFYEFPIFICRWKYLCNKMEISARPIPKTDAKNSGDEAKEVNYIYANELSFLKQYLQERPRFDSKYFSHKILNSN